MKSLFLRALVYTLAIGSGVMVLALLCISSAVWFSKRPEPWKKINGELEVVGKAIDWGQYTNDLALPADAIFEPIDPQTRGNSQFQHQLLTAPQFAAEIKHRNPELSSMDDDVLVREVLKRRPEFLKIEGLPPGARPIFDKGDLTSPLRLPTLLRTTTNFETGKCGSTP